MTYLAIIDRGYRGSIEAQFFDALYGVLTFREQLGAIDVVLRGTSVTAAVDGGGVPSLRLGSTVVDTMPDPRASVRAMIEQDVTVYVDERSVELLGLSGTALLPGVTCLDTTELACRWAEYEEVWFL